MKMFRIILGLAVLFWITPSIAAVTNTPVFVQTPSIGFATFIQGTDSAGTYKTIYTGGANGSKCNAMTAVGNDNSATHLITVEIVHGSPTLPVVTAVLLPLSGAASTFGTPINLMSYINWPGLPVDSDGNPFFFLASGDTLKATFATNLTSTDQINVMSVCSDF